MIITSANAAHYIGFDENGEWMWVDRYSKATYFPSLESAQAFAAEFLSDMAARDLVWYLGKGANYE